MDTQWFLEGVAADGTHVLHEIETLPYSVGRDPGNQLMLQALGLSRRHAELAVDGAGHLVITDLGSTNGTWVNRERIEGAAVVVVNDIIHFGNAEFRLGKHREESVMLHDDNRTMIVPKSKMSQNFVPQERQFREFLLGQGIAGAVQPIVQARTCVPVAYELLGRCSHPELPTSPMRLFGLAALLNSEAELSRAFRQYGVRATAELLQDKLLFVNTHPKEAFEGGLLEELAQLRRDGIHTQIVVELHETAVIDIKRMRELAAKLKHLDIRFAYDDFGAGQARLNELGEVPAHYVKFDMGLVRGIDLASDGKRKMLSDLVHIVQNLGSIALAEGVETEGEAEVCCGMGFELIQGYLTGKPMGIEQFRSNSLQEAAGLVWSQPTDVLTVPTSVAGSIRR
jgi:EAL domain-containing protein (putative c-di-GMP-specific phosphodiesterase class I)